MTGVYDYDDAVDRYLRKLTPKIVGGKLAAQNAFPWQVSLGVAAISDAGQAHFCGGALLSQRTIVTAAHCVTGLNTSQLKIALGANRLDAASPRFSLAAIIPHPGYDKRTKDNDIALLRLEQPVAFDTSVAAITPIPAAQETTVLVNDTKFTVTGWGATSQGGNAVRDLRQVEVDFVPHDLCTDPLSYGSKITDNMLCAGSTKADSCQGDSGGPLTTKGDVPFVVGIVSWGKGCASPGQFGVYTRIARFEAWIQTTTAFFDSPKAP